MFPECIPLTLPSSADLTDSLDAEEGWRSLTVPHCVHIVLRVVVVILMLMVQRWLNVCSRYKAINKLAFLKNKSYLNVFIISYLNRDSCQTARVLFWCLKIVALITNTDFTTVKITWLLSLYWTDYLSALNEKPNLHNMNYEYHLHWPKPLWKPLLPPPGSWSESIHFFYIERWDFAPYFNFFKNKASISICHGNLAIFTLNSSPPSGYNLPLQSLWWSTATNFPMTRLIESFYM